MNVRRLTRGNRQAQMVDVLMTRTAKAVPAVISMVPAGVVADVTPDLVITSVQKDKAVLSTRWVTGCAVKTVIPERV